MASARAASRLPGTAWYTHLLAAFAELADGDADAARHCVQSALKMRPDMTLAEYRTIFPFPKTAALFEIGDRNGANERIVELGLPRG